jgi:hypothetical protein
VCVQEHELCVCGGGGVNVCVCGGGGGTGGVVYLGLRAPLEMHKDGISCTMLCLVMSCALKDLGL